MIKSRKSAIEVQFNWLFVLIVGAVILIVFFGFTSKQKNVSEEITRSSIVSSLDAIIKSAQSAAGEVSIVPVSEEELEIGCNRISVGDASKQYESLILFSPKRLEASRLITHTIGLNVPYRAANLLFVTSPDVRYILIADFHEATNAGNLARFVNRSIPKEVSKETYYINRPTAGGVARDAADRLYSLIINNGDKKVRAIIISAGGLLPPNWSPVRDRFTAMKGDYSELVVNPSGALSFLQYENAAWATKTSQFIEESAIGSVYSDDAEQYKCSMDNAFRRIKQVSGVYKERAIRLGSDASTSADCDSEYTISSSILNSRIVDNSDFRFPDSIGDINRVIATLVPLNSRLQALSCPLVY